MFQAVERQLQLDWSIERLCQLVHYSAPHLHRLCKRCLGRSPLQRVIFLRMNRAKTLLSSTGLSITQIAEQVGYQEVSNFSKRFKKSIGVSPAAYRQQQSSSVG